MLRLHDCFEISFVWLFYISFPLPKVSSTFMAAGPDWTVGTGFPSFPLRSTRFFPGLSCYPPTTSAMSQTFTEPSSRSNYQAIFDSALEAYKKKTGKDLTSNPLLRSFKTCHSPDAILAILKAQIIGPGQSQSSGDKLLTWLNPTINVLIAFSAAIGATAGQVSLQTFEVTRSGSAA